LARVTGDPENRKLEEIENIREYQLTLRNTSDVHLQDVEIQFEFPTDDVEAWAERPALSKTAPVPVDALITEPWKKGYRWRIPQLPSTDSIEFTFRSINPASDNYAVALYKSDRVVIERSKGEPSARGSFSFGVEKLEILNFVIPGILMVCVLGILATLLLSGQSPFPGSTSNLAEVKEDGCAVMVMSSFDRVYGDGWFWTRPWQITQRVVNNGPANCTVKADQLIGPEMIPAFNQETRETLSKPKPQLVDRTLFVGRDSPTHVAKVKVYGEPN